MTSSCKLCPVVVASVAEAPVSHLIPLQGLSSAQDTLGSQAYGANNRARVISWSVTTAFCMSVLAVPMAVILYFGDWLAIYIFQQPKEVADVRALAPAWACCAPAASVWLDCWELAMLSLCELACRANGCFPALPARDRDIGSRADWRCCVRMWQLVAIYCQGMVPGLLPLVWSIVIMKARPQAPCRLPLQRLPPCPGSRSALAKRRQQAHMGPSWSLMLFSMCLLPAAQA